MRLALLLLVAGTCALPAMAQTVEGNAQDVAAIHRLIDGHAVGWNKGDAAMVARLWHEDGDIRSGDNTIVKGREAIQARYQKMFEGWAKGTTHSHPGAVTIRFLSPQVVVADGFYEVDGIKSQTGGPSTEKGAWTIVCTKVNGKWGIASLR
jgi:uncharacterized protein (TIGR02246 family)